MERTANKTVKFKKVGGGSFIMGKRMIKPGQIFEAAPDEIPVQFRNVVVPVDDTGQIWGTEAQTKQSPIPTVQNAVKPIYSKRPRGANNLWFDIVTETGKDKEGKPEYKVLNDKALREEQADKLIEDLMR